jgi:hypothetical protein
MTIILGLKSIEEYEMKTLGGICSQYRNINQTQ